MVISENSAGRLIPLETPIRWERIQPTLNSPLSSTESARLQSFVSRAGTAGLGVILDIHNFGGYYLYDNTQAKGVQRKIGSAELPQAYFTDLWTRLSTLFKNDTNLLGYDLMNEPNGLPTGFTVGSTLATFDSSTDGWVGEGSTSVAQDTSIFNTGTGSLRATKTYGSGAVVSRFNNGQGSTLHNISANGLSLSVYVFIPSNQPGTGWQGHIEVQKPDFSFATGTNVNLTKGVWTNITYTMTSTVAASMRAVVVQFSGNNVNATASAYLDDVTQGTSQTPQKLWENSSQAALDAIRANNDTKIVMVEGYNFAGAQNWTTNHPTAWITDSANNFRYEAHHYWDNSNSGTYTNNYATEVTNALSHSYVATGTQAPTGTLSINSGSATTTSTSVTLTPSATDDVDNSSWLQMKISNLADLSDASWEAYSSSKAWTLTSGTGTKTVYTQFRDSAGNQSSITSASIAYTANSSSSGSSNTTSSTTDSSSAKAPVCSTSKPSSAPTLTSVTSLSPSTISLTYTNSGEPFDAYYLEFGTESGKYNLGGGKVAGKGTNTYVVSSLGSGKKYFFRIRGGNDCASGPWSNELSTTTQSLIPFNTLTLENTVIKPKAPPKQTNTNQQQATPTPTPTSAPEVKKYDLNISVVDTDKKPVVGATVVLHSTPRQATTDTKGIAHFTKVEEGDHHVAISYNKFQGEETIHLSGDNIKTFDLNVQVKPVNFWSSPVMIIAIIQLLIIILLVWFIIRKPSLYHKFTGQFSRKTLQ